MDAAPAQRVQVQRQCGAEGFALAGPHLRDLPLVQDDRADKLHVEGPHAQRAPGALACHRESLLHDVIEGLARLQAVAEMLGAALQLAVRKRFHLRFQRVNARHTGTRGRQFALVRVNEPFRKSD